MNEITQAESIQPLSATQIRQQVNLIQEVMKEVMTDGQHFGKIPGCGDKPTLLKPGAEKLSMVFRLRPVIDNNKDVSIERLDLGHIEVRVYCHILSMSGLEMATGVGSCSTMESKFRYRGGERKCPECGKATIIKGKAEYGGGWLCFAKKGGCGAKWPDGAPEIESQQVGRVENPDIADTYNTVLKMAKKRAYVDGILSATAASDIFTQDIEDLPQDVVIPAPAAQPVAKNTPQDVVMPKSKKEAEKPLGVVTKEQGIALINLALGNGWSADDVKGYIKSLGYQKHTELNEWDYKDCMGYFASPKELRMKEAEIDG